MCVHNIVEYSGGPMKARRKHGEMQPVHFLEDWFPSCMSDVLIFALVNNC